MGMGNVVKAIWMLLQGTTNPNVLALYNNLYQQLEGAKMGLGQGRKGNIFFVNGGADGVTAGLNTNDGLTPANAFLTIAYAMTLCTVNDNDDFIYCFNVYNQEAFPITITGDSIHIIGLAGPDGSWPALDATSTGDVSVFDFAVGVENCEIAQFNLAAGATAPCIEVASGTNMLWIHNCYFGHDWFAGGQDGIDFLNLGGSLRNVIVEDNWFWGDTGGCGTLTRFGIVQSGGSMMACTIRRNYFGGLANGAINIGVNASGAGPCHDNIVCDNYIGCASDTAGIAIYLGEDAYGCIVAHNEAQHGRDAASMVQNPYLDQAALATDNHWMSNQVGNEMEYPAT